MMTLARFTDGQICKAACAWSLSLVKTRAAWLAGLAWSFVPAAS